MNPVVVDNVPLKKAPRMVNTGDAGSHPEEYRIKGSVSSTVELVFCAIDPIKKDRMKNSM